MLIDIVIPYRFSPVTRDAELRYTLRGIEKYLTGVRYIWLVGDRPAYISEQVRQIRYTEKDWYQFLTRNIHDKLSLAANHPDVSEMFLYFNDDHFLLRPYEALGIPYYHKGNEWVGTGKYSITLGNTLRKYPCARNFDTHAPILLHKKLYKEALEWLPWKTPFGFAIKTCYCEYFKIHGEYYPDYKIARKPEYKDFEDILKRKFFSVDDKAMTKEMLSFLNTLYPDKSKYEI